MDGSQKLPVLCVCGFNVDKVILAGWRSLNIFHMQKRTEL